MLCVKVYDPTVHARLQTKSIKPPRPPAGLAAVLIGSSDLSSELVVAVDGNGTMTVQLHAPRLEASGAASAVIRRFRDGSVFALADVPVAGYDVASDRRVAGKVSVGLSWSPEAEDGSTDIAGSALAEGSWSRGPLKFGVVAHHSFSSKVIRLLSTTPSPPVGTGPAASRSSTSAPTIVGGDPAPSLWGPRTKPHPFQVPTRQSQRPPGP